MTPPPLDRREKPRVRFRASVTFFPAQSSLSGNILEISKKGFRAKSLDVSEGGIRLLLHSDCPIGTILKLSFRLPKKNALTSVYAQARWKRDNWMGFQFLVLGKGDQEQIRQYAKKLDPSKPHQR